MNSSNTTYHYQAVCIRILFSKWKADTDNPFRFKDNPSTYKVNRMIKPKMNESDEEEIVKGTERGGEVQDDESDIEELYGGLGTGSTQHSSESGEETGLIQQGFRHLTGFGSNFVWNRVIPGPWT